MINKMKKNTYRDPCLWVIERALDIRLCTVDDRK